jgi:L-iditol 2-dehydrogenase
MTTMIPAARLHGPEDLRVELVPHPGEPPPGQVLLRVEVVGICGSDLHTYRHARIGDTALAAPLIPGHEFAGIVDRVGADCRDGHGHALSAGVRVAVDPAQPCGQCEWCLRGDPNLCPQIVFCGLFPHQGAMRPWMHVPAATCFPVPAGMDATTAMMLEPLGVAIHSSDLAKIRLSESVAVIGAGPIGLCLLRLAAAAGAGAIFAADRLPWRVLLAAGFGPATAFCTPGTDFVQAVLDATGGRGVDVAFEAASGGPALQQAADILAPGGRLIAVGIDEDDRFVLRHSTLRRKGLTIRMVRRMKHSYARAIYLAEHGQIDLRALVSHHYPLEQAPEAFAANAAYREGAVKVAVDCHA